MLGMSYEWDGHTERIPHTPPAQPAPAKAAPNVVAIVSIACAAVGFLILPILLAPAAIISGAVGANLSRTRLIGGQRLAILGMLVGLLEIVHIIAA